MTSFPCNNGPSCASWVSCCYPFGSPSSLYCSVPLSDLSTIRLICLQLRLAAHISSKVTLQQNFVCCPPWCIGLAISFDCLCRNNLFFPKAYFHSLSRNGRVFSHFIRCVRWECKLKAQKDRQDSGKLFHRTSRKSIFSQRGKQSWLAKVNRTSQNISVKVNIPHSSPLLCCFPFSCMAGFAFSA